MSDPPGLSIVVPFYDEEGNVEPVLTELRGAYPDAEIIAVDDGSRDASAARMDALAGIQVLRLDRHRGQSAATLAGLKQARGEVCVLMDGDGQSDPAEIKRVLQFIPEYDFVSGSRVERRDTAWRLLISRAANALRRVVTGDGMHDTGGTPKAMKRVCVDALVPFDGLHRFLPALLQSAGYRGIEVPVAHRARFSGNTKYTSVGRALRGLWDLFGVRWLMARQIHRREP